MEQVIVDALQKALERNEKSFDDLRQALKEVQTNQEELKLSAQKNELTQKQTDNTVILLTAKVDTLASKIETLQVRNAVVMDREEQQRFIKSNLRYPMIFALISGVISLLGIGINLIWLIFNVMKGGG